VPRRASGLGRLGLAREARAHAGIQRGEERGAWLRPRRDTLDA
jgi:hypothetical protein